MKIYSQRLFKQAQELAQLALESGSEMQWIVAMQLLRASYGFIPVEYYEVDNFDN